MFCRCVCRRFGGPNIQRQTCERRPRCLKPIIVEVVDDPNKIITSLLTDDTRIDFDERNPYTGALQGHVGREERRKRYEAYKVAETVDEARALGATDNDLHQDLNAYQCAEIIDVSAATAPLASGASASAAASGPVDMSASLAKRAAFESLPRDRWNLPANSGSRKMREDAMHIYITHNASKMHPRPIRLSDQYMQDHLPRAYEMMMSDWDGYMKKHHEGFTSFSNTVGTYDGNEQKANTRVLGPSVDAFDKFGKHYDWWDRMKDEVESAMRAKFQADATNMQLSETLRQTNQENLECPPELFDVHILRQKMAARSADDEGPSGSSGGAVFGDHQVGLSSLVCTGLLDEMSIAPLNRPAWLPANLLVMSFLLRRIDM